MVGSARVSEAGARGRRRLRAPELEPALYVGSASRAAPSRTHVEVAISTLCLPSNCRRSDPARPARLPAWASICGGKDTGRADAGEADLAVRPGRLGHEVTGKETPQLGDPIAAAKGCALGLTSSCAASVERITDRLPSPADN